MELIRPMEYKATLRYLHITPRKVKRLADLMRGRSARQARTILSTSLKRPRGPLLKLLDSAVANARAESELDIDTLSIGSIRVNPAPKSRRFIPRAFGRTSLVEKRMSHVTLVLAGEPSSPEQKPSFALPPIPAESAKTETKPTRGPHAPREARPATRQTRIGALGRRLFRRKTI